MKYLIKNHNKGLVYHQIGYAFNSDKIIPKLALKFSIKDAICSHTLNKPKTKRYRLKYQVIPYE